MSRVAGTLHITVDGKSLDITGTVTIPMAKSTKTPITTLNGSVHYSEVPIAPSIEGTFLVTKEFPIEDIANGDDMTIVAELANGLTYTLSGAFVDGEMNFESEGGNASIKFSGQNGRWG